MLLKPTTDRGAQVIIQGRSIGTMDAVAYHDYKRIARAAVLESFHRLAARFDPILVEGAGSPAEINLRANDIANMGFAEAVDCPVILIADIDRGGVFAQFVGTLALLSEPERARVKGFVINRFRGDLSLLQPGLDWLERETGRPVLGVLPYLMSWHLDAEDAIATSQPAKASDALRVLVPALPRISNHTDLDPLRLHPQVELRFVRGGESHPPADLILLPGSKSVRSDLAWLRREGWDQTIARHLRYGGRVLGICGGMQMLGRRIDDPQGLEGEPGDCAGLGLLALDTRLEPEKTLRNVTGRLNLSLGEDEAPLVGYEIHAGVTIGEALERPAAILDGGRPDGALSDDGQILAIDVHGLFESADACAALLRWAGLDVRETPDYRVQREAAIERLADTVETHLDMTRIQTILDRGAALDPRRLLDANA